MSKTVVRRPSCENILDECKIGNFEKTLKYINTNLMGKITSRIAIKILISCSNACFYKKDDISEESLLKILRSIQPFFRNLSETDCFNYIQSMYHVTKFLIYKNSLKMILQMEDILMLDFQSDQLPKEHIDTYHNMVKLLHNLIANSASRTIENSTEMLFKLSSLILRLCAKFLDTPTAISVVSGCLSSLVYIKISVQYQMEYYKTVLNTLDFRQVKPRCETVFKYIQTFSCGILDNILIFQDLKKGISFINDITSQLKIVLNHEEYIHLHQILRYFLIINLNDKSSEISKCTDSLLKLDKIWDKADCKKELYKHIYKLLKNTTNYYISCPKEYLSFSEEVQLQLIKILPEMNLLSANSTSNETENLYVSISYAKITVSLVKHLMHKNSNLEYHQQCVDILGTFFEDNQLNITDFGNCSKAWTNLAIEIYNTGIILYQQQSTAAYLYFHFMLKLFVNLEDIHGTVYLKYEALNSTCTVLVEIYLKDCKTHLAHVSLAVFLCITNRDYFMTRWIQSKHSHKDKEEIQSLNLVTAIELIYDFIPELKLNNSDKITLLNIELENYKRKWRSKVSTICALKELIKIADTENIVKTIVNIFIDTDSHWHCEEISDIFHNTIKTYEKLAITTASKVNLALLYYIYFKISHKVIMLKNGEDMEKALHSDRNHLDPSDVKQECDIPSFESLQLDMCNENFRNLELSLLMFNEVVPELKIDDFEEARLLYESLLGIFFQFKLAGFNVKGIQALELALKIAQMLNNVPFIIKSIGFIIEQTGLNQDNSQKLVKVADTLIEDACFNVSDNLELCISYYICKSKALLYNDYRESYNIFRKAKDLFQLIEVKNRIIESQLFLLNSTFRILPCNLAVEVHEKSLLMNAYLAMEIILEEHKMSNLSKEPYMILLLIQAGEEIVKLYYHLKCPREARIYAKQIYSFSQALVLPIPVAKFLMYLAHFDLLLDRQDDCQFKIRDMASILDLNKVTDFSEKTYLKQHSTSSPSLQTRSFCIPSTAFHKNTCACFYCESDEYQILVLEKMRLSALINVKENNVAVAEDFFRGALTLYEYYSQRLSKKRDFVPDFLPSYGYVLLNYSSHLWRTNNKCEALNLNTKLLEYVEKEKLKNLHLYNDALVQRLGYLTENVVPESEPELLTEIDNLQVSDVIDLSKTPENKQSKVSFVVEHSEFNSPQKLKVKKCLPFTFSPSEAVTSKKSSKNYNLTQSPKILIYTEVAEKRTKQKIHSTNTEKTQTLKLPMTSVLEKKMRQKTKELPTANSTSSVVDKSLKKRTKLLTERLKKNGDSSSEIENQAHCNLQGVSKNYPVKKNLMNDLVDAEQKVAGKGAIRKSARAKK